MSKHAKSLNNTPYDKHATPEQKADEFDRQFAENQAKGQQAEQDFQDKLRGAK